MNIPGYTWSTWQSRYSALSSSTLVDGLRNGVLAHHGAVQLGEVGGVNMAADSSRRLATPFKTVWACTSASSRVCWTI